MKKFYCPTCKKFKSRLQIKRVSDTRVSYLMCRYCHNTNIYTTEDVVSKLINKTLKYDDLNSRHGSFL